MINMKSNKFYKIVLITHIIFSVASLVGTLKYCSCISGKEVGQIDISQQYLKFFLMSESQMIFNIAIHNLLIAIIAFIFSSLTYGILGNISLISAFNVAGVVIYTSREKNTWIFLILELIGIILAVEVGTYISFNSQMKLVSLKKGNKFLMKFIAGLATIYLIASYIEVGIIGRIKGG